MNIKKITSMLVKGLAFGILLAPLTVDMPTAQAAGEDVVIDAVDYGADPTGQKDSTSAIQDAFAAAKHATEEGAASVTVSFPEGEYHIYKDYAATREYHTSNTNSIDNPIKTIGLLIEDQENFTLEGNGSLFMMHGNMMALAVVNSENVKLENFSWDFGVPTVTEMTVAEMGTTEDGKPYTDFLIPECFPHEVSGNTITWYSEKSPHTGEYYWTQTGNHSPTYAVVAYQPDGEMSRNYYTSDGPFTNVSSIAELDDTHVRIVYNSSRPSMQKEGTVIELAANAHRETAGAFTWESKNVVADHVNVHFMHGFGWLIQMSTDVYYYDCNLTPREGSGHITVSFADGIHASGAAGELVIENCNFANTHDDPINLHGTFTRVEERNSDGHTLTLKYIHTQQGGFPQFHVGDQVAFFTRDTLESTDNETLYTVAEAVSNPGENGNDLRTMVIRFEEELPEDLSDKIGSEPKYVAENVTYAPTVTIRNCTFKQVPTRGILCTTRNPALIEGNTFKNMSMATIYLSNDSNEWYESGPIRDMTIRNNEFYIKSIGRTAWEYAPAIYVNPVTKGGGLPSEDNPIHKNITIEGNTFHMDVDTVVKAESVENLTIRNNTILRTNPDVSVTIETEQGTLLAGDTLTLKTMATGKQNNGTCDNVYEFTKCKNVLLEGNTYDDGLKRYAVLSGMSDSSLTNKDADITVIHDDRSQPASAPATNIQYTSSDPDVLSVDENGKMTAKKAGAVTVKACYNWNGEEIWSNSIEMNVIDTVAPEDVVTIQGEGNVLLQEEGAEYTFQAETVSGKEIVWSVEDFLTGGTTDAAVISEDGVLTAKKSGVVWVRAGAGVSADRRAVIISLPDEGGTLNPKFQITRPDASNYTLTEESITVDMQAGDLYENSNSVKNLFLYQIPDAVAKDNLRTVIKIENMPVKESGQWDTASFLLYKDDDNYISVGKKSHYDGIATVTETAGSATETGGDAEYNAVTTAYLGFYVDGSTVSVDFRMEDGEWQHVSDLSAEMLGSDYKIGFTGWETNDRGKTITFSEFRVGSGGFTYGLLLEQPAISFTDTENENHAPTASDAAWGEKKYNVGDIASVSYTFADADGDTEGQTLYCFTYEDGMTVVAAEPNLALERIGKVKCEIYPVDCKGRPGASVSADWAEVIDWAGLDEAVGDAGALDLSIYTTESAAKYAAALSAAKLALNNPDATQEEIDRALEALKTAKEALEKRPAGTGSTGNTQPDQTGTVQPAPVQPEQPVGDTGQADNVPNVGTVFEVNGIQYKVTRSGVQDGAVAAVKLMGKQKAKLTIPATVKKDGYTYQVTAIQANAFQKNTKLKTLVIGSNVTQVGKNAFYKCTKLKSVTFKGKNAPKIGRKAFKGIAAKSRIIVPKKMTVKQLKLLKKRMKAAGAGSKAVYKKK